MELRQSRAKGSARRETRSPRLASRSRGGSPERLRPSTPAPAGIGPPVLLHLDGRPSASVRERLVVEARDDVQVRVLRGLIDLRKAVPDECVTVRGEAFVLCGLRLDEKFV